MGLHLKDQERRSELQSKVASDLAERLRTQESVDTGDIEPAFNDNSHQTRPAGMALIVLSVVAFFVVVFVALKMTGVL